MVNLFIGDYGQYYSSIYGSSTEPLNEEQMLINAKYIKLYLMSKGFSQNSIYAILGNMQAESSLNPGRWQNDTVSPNLTSGYGLVQWTPASNYLYWCDSHSLVYHHMDSNLQRIVYEVENNLQWISTPSHKYSFKDFSNSTNSIEELAKAFLLNYERPADQSESVQNYRASLALEWASRLGNITITSNKKKKYNFILFGIDRRRKQWIRKPF